MTLAKLNPHPHLLLTIVSTRPQNLGRELRKAITWRRARSDTDPYLIAARTSEESIQEFMAKSPGARHLYEIRVSPQADIVVAVMSAEHIAELARLREFL
jgi:hypothetical protein